MWLIPAVVAVAFVGLLGGLWMRRRARQARSERLREEYGGEYDYTVRRAGDRETAEHELDRRRRRMESLALQPLGQDEARRISRAWLDTQSHFVDAPADAIRQADGLVAEVMELRGYPVGDFEQRAADVSVEHPQLVANYRAAHATALRNSRGAATTEELRQAMVQYRDLFTELLETRVVDAQLPPRPRPDSAEET